jgi:hypothetical protein
LAIEDDEDQQESVEQMLLSLSVVRRICSLLTYFHEAVRQKTSHQGDAPEVDVVIASMDVNSETRAAAVQGMLRTTCKPAELDSEHLVSILS